MKKLRVVAAALTLALAPSLVAAQADSAWRDWNKPVAPFRIAPNLYYVGASDVTSFLFTSPEGHILLDGGFEETAPQILANIKTLGFNARDVRLIINTHAHNDHAGGLAALKAATGAKLVTSAPDAAQLAAGGRDNYGFGDKMTFAAVKADSIIRDGSTLRVGGWTLVANITPGHTKGCTTWTTTIPVNGVPRGATFMCSASVPGYKLVGNTGYPRIIEDYEASFRKLRTLDCSFFLASHGTSFNLKAKAAKVRSGEIDPNPFIDPKGCAEWIDANEKAFKAQVARERGAKP